MLLCGVGANRRQFNTSTRASAGSEYDLLCGGVSEH
jgi:hypothetical protein